MNNFNLSFLQHYRCAFQNSNFSENLSILNNFMNINAMNFLQNGFDFVGEKEERGNFFKLYLKYLKYIGIYKLNPSQTKCIEVKNKKFHILRTKLYGIVTDLPKELRLQCLRIAYLMGLSSDSNIDVCYQEQDDKIFIILVKSGKKKIYNYPYLKDEMLFFSNCELIQNFVILRKIFKDNLLPLGLIPVISSHFGVKDKLTKGKRRRHPHPGIDLLNKGNKNGSIMSMSDGIVEESIFKKDGYGFKVIINHGIYKGECVRTLYAHMDESFVKQGDAVHIGDIIGRIGSTGMSTSPHLHLEFRIGNQKINPEGNEKNNALCLKQYSTPKEMQSRLKVFKTIIDIMYKILCDQITIAL